MNENMKSQSQMQRLLKNLREWYPQVPDPDLIDDNDDDWASMRWNSTGRGCFLEVVFLDNDIVQTNYPGSIDGFDQFKIDDPRLIVDLATQFYPDEPRVLDHIYEFISPLWAGQEPGKIYPHNLRSSLLLSDEAKQVFTKLYPDIVASVPDPGTQWGTKPEPSDEPVYFRFSVKTDYCEFPKGEMLVAEWLNKLKESNPDDFVRWERTFREISDDQNWNPDMELLSSIFRFDEKQIEELVMHPEPPIRHVATFLDAIRLRKKPERLLTISQIKAVTKRSGIPFLSTLGPD